MLGKVTDAATALDGFGKRIQTQDVFTSIWKRLPSD